MIKGQIVVPNELDIYIVTPMPDKNFFLMPDIPLCLIYGHR